MTSQKRDCHGRFIKSDTPSDKKSFVTKKQLEKEVQDSWFVITKLKSELVKKNKKLLEMQETILDYRCAIIIIATLFLSIIGIFVYFKFQ